MKAFPGTAAAGVALALLAACTPGATAPSPSPTPTAATTPAETPLERQTRLDYAAAEEAFRTFNAEVNKVFQGGGSASATQVMKQTAAGEYLEFYATTSANLVRNGAKQTGSVVIRKVTPYGYSDVELILRVCEDGRDISVASAKKRFGSGELRQGNLTARKLNGSWKIWKATTEKVQECS